MNKDAQNIVLLAAGIGLSFIVVLGTIMYVAPQYGVWKESLSGKAELQKAEYTRQVAVLEAQAKMESASKLAEAEIIRAEGVAKANEIIGDSLQGKDGYLQYLWITEGEKNTNRTVYMVPSNGGAPVPTFSVGELAEQPPAPQK